PAAIATAGAPDAAGTPAQSEAATPSPAKQDQAAPQPVMELASAESRRVTLPDPAPTKPPIATANAAPSPQAFVSAVPPAPDQPQPSGFPVHQLVIALCGALGVAGALRFVVGA